jgi:hypothetical protein
VGGDERRLTLIYLARTAALHNEELRQADLTGRRLVASGRWMVGGREGGREGGRSNSSKAAPCSTAVAVAVAAAATATATVTVTVTVAAAAAAAADDDDDADAEAEVETRRRRDVCSRATSYLSERTRANRSDYVIYLVLVL